MSDHRAIIRFATACVCASMIGAAVGQSPPPADPKSPPRLETRYTAVMDSIRVKLPEPQWELQQRVMTPKEIAKALGDDLKKEGKAIVATMTEGEALGGNNYYDKQMIVVTILRFKEQENALQYMEMVHKVSREKFELLGRKTPGTTIEVKEADLMVIGSDGSCRLIVNNETGPRSGSTYVNRFIKGPTFVEVSVVSKDPKKSVDMTITEEALAAVKRL